MTRLIAVSLLSIALPAAAHVTLAQREAPADSYYKAVLRAPHGCKTSPTVSLRMRLPEGVMSVKPQPKPGWKLEITLAKLAQPLDDGHGGKITERVSEVRWSGGKLANEHFDEFAVMMRLPDRAGSTLYFPVVQECEQGVHRWIEIPEAGGKRSDLKEPAPALRLTPKQ